MHRRVHPQHNNEVDPALGEQIARVPVDYAPAGLALLLDGVKKLQPVSSATIPQLVPPPLGWFFLGSLTLSSSTIQLWYSSSQPSWHSLSLTTWFTLRCFRPVFSARTSQWVVLPVPGVPVTMIFGRDLAMFVSGTNDPGGNNVGVR